MCIVLQRERGNAWHRVEIDGVGVLEEENAVQIISLQPFLDDSVLPAQAKNHGKYAVEAEVNVAVAVRLLDDVALGVDGDFALEIANRGDTVLHHDVDLVLAHSEVVVLLQVVHGADCEKEKKKERYISWLFSEVMMAKGRMQLGRFERCWNGKERGEVPE